jgi:hypothetical protein
LNLCRPDQRQSCAACCGLYNVADGTRDTLHRNLENRTRLFLRVLREPDALQEFKDTIRDMEAVSPLDNVIYVCEFTGFPDADRNVVGCMLHPSSAGNNGIDLRGMCHYGSMACKTFFCPAWDEVSGKRLRILLDAIEDWYLYGLVVTDVDFVDAIFGLLEDVVGGPLDPDTLLIGRAGDVFREMLSWKNTWPFRGDSTVRRSRYYCKREASETTSNSDNHIKTLTEILRFTFDLERPTDEWEMHTRFSAERFAEAYSRR